MKYFQKLKRKYIKYTINKMFQKTLDNLVVEHDGAIIHRDKFLKETMEKLQEDLLYKLKEKNNSDNGSEIYVYFHDKIEFYQNEIEKVNNDIILPCQMQIFEVKKSWWDWAAEFENKKYSIFKVIGLYMIYKCDDKMTRKFDLSADIGWIGNLIDCEKEI